VSTDIEAVAFAGGPDTLALLRRRDESFAVTVAHATTPTARCSEEAEMVEEGAPAPDFTLTSDSGEPVTLSSLRGRDVVLYFYPKDDSLERK
jgi:hypothetical protein